MNDHRPADTDAAHETRGAAPISVDATSETSWIITPETGDLILGHISEDDGTFTAYDAQELRIGTFPTRDDAITAITTGTL